MYTLIHQSSSQINICFYSTEDLASASRSIFCYRLIGRAVDSRLDSPPSAHVGNTANGLLHTMLEIACRSKFLGNANKILRDTRWCISRTILGLVERLERFDNLVQSSKFAKISINLEKTLSQNQSCLLTHTVNSDVCF